MAANASWSRRRMLVLTASAAGAAALAGPLGSAASAASGGGPAAATTGLRRDHWTAVIGRQVTIGTPGGRVKATVASVEDLPTSAPGHVGCFSVDLRFARGPALSGVHPVTIPGRGVTTLLLSAVDRGARHRTSQIVVNRPT